MFHYSNITFRLVKTIGSFHLMWYNIISKYSSRNKNQLFKKMAGRIKLGKSLI